MSHNHIMLDLETMGSSTTAAIIAIGAVRFGNGNIMDEFYQPVNLQTSVTAGLTMDASTVLWWMKQSDEARQVFNQPTSTIGHALIDFKSWLGKAEDVVLWGNGADFDNAILSNAYQMVLGQIQPWSYYNNRCYRTIKSLYPDIKQQRIGTHHNALDDARHQAMQLMQIISV